MRNPEYDEDTQRTLHLFTVLMRCTQAVAAHARQDISRHGLTPSEFGVLELLYHKGATPLGAISERILLTSGSITHVIDTLERKQLVCRVACPKDRRVLYADLTETGARLIADAFPAHAERIRHALAGLNPGEQETLAALARRLGLSARQSLANGRTETATNTAATQTGKD